MAAGPEVVAARREAATGNLDAAPMSPNLRGPGRGVDTERRPATLTVSPAVAGAGDVGMAAEPVGRKRRAVHERRRVARRGGLRLDDRPGVFPALGQFATGRFLRRVRLEAVVDDQDVATGDGDLLECGAPDAARERVPERQAMLLDISATESCRFVAAVRRAGGDLPPLSAEGVPGMRMETGAGTSDLQKRKGPGEPDMRTDIDPGATGSGKAAASDAPVPRAKSAKSETWRLRFRQARGAWARERETRSPIARSRAGLPPPRGISTSIRRIFSPNALLGPSDPGAFRLADPVDAQSMDVPESLASGNAEIGAFDEAEIPPPKKRKQLSVPLRGDALRHERPGTQSRLERHPVARIVRSVRRHQKGRAAFVHDGGGQFSDAHVVAEVPYRSGGIAGIDMGQAGGGHVMPALPDSGPAVQPAKSQPLGERDAVSEVLGLSIALYVVDEIGGHGVVVVEPEGDSGVVRGGPASGQIGDGGGERLLRGQRRQERRMDVGIGRKGFFQAVGEGPGQLVGGQDKTGEAVRRLRRERGKADRLEQAHSLLQTKWVMNETSPLVEPPVAGQREAGRFGREVGKADEAENLGHSTIRAMIAS